jgi:hypothetical protein
MAGLAQAERGSPHPVFSELRILKDFKCCVLKLRILMELRMLFAELRILKGLSCFALDGIAELGWKLDFNAESTEFAERWSRKGKRRQSKYDWKSVEVDGERSIGHGSRKSGLLSIFL